MGKGGEGRWWEGEGKREDEVHVTLEYIVVFAGVIPLSRQKDVVETLEVENKLPG